MFQRTIGRTIAAALFCILLAACGGGGGGEAVPQAAPITPADTGSGNPASPAPAGSGSPPPVQELPANPPPAGETPSSRADATAARFNRPRGIAVDSGGTLYVADAGNNTIRKITPEGSVTTLAGAPGQSGSADGTGTAARFSFLKGVAVDGSGNVYAVDHNAIRKITPAGVVTTLAGMAGESGDADGAGATARFRNPWGVAVDEGGSLYVGDTGNFLVRKVSPAGVVSTYAGTRGMRGTADGSTATATFLGPAGIALDGDGNLYLTDWFGPPAPNIPEASTLVRRIAANGSVTTMAGNLASENAPAAFNDTFAIAADAGGNAYLAAMRSVRKISPAGTISVLAAPGEQLRSFNGLAIDQSGTLFVTDESNHTVSRVAPDGTFTLIAGKTGESGSTDAAGQ